MYKLTGHIQVDNLALGNILTLLDLEVTIVTNLVIESRVFFQRQCICYLLSAMTAFLIFDNVIMCQQIYEKDSSKLSLHVERGYTEHTSTLPIIFYCEFIKLYYRQ